MFCIANRSGECYAAFLVGCSSADTMTVVSSSSSHCILHRLDSSWPLSSHPAYSTIRHDADNNTDARSFASIHSARSDTKPKSRWLVFCQYWREFGSSQRYVHVARSHPRLA